RIAILYVFAGRDQVLERAKQRAKITGRHVPVEEIEDSLLRVPKTVERLRPKADFVAYIKVKEVEDSSTLLFITPTTIITLTSFWNCTI
ncbi:unnamed protein product, partial [Choristocarpus tenellus]